MFYRLFTLLLRLHRSLRLCLSSTSGTCIRWHRRRRRCRRCSSSPSPCYDASIVVIFRLLSHHLLAARSIVDSTLRPSSLSSSRATHPVLLRGFIAFTPTPRCINPVFDRTPSVRHPPVEITPSPSYAITLQSQTLGSASIEPRILAPIITSATNTNEYSIDSLIVDCHSLPTILYSTSCCNLSKAACFCYSRNASVASIDRSSLRRLLLIILILQWSHRSVISLCSVCINAHRGGMLFNDIYRCLHQQRSASPSTSVLYLDFRWWYIIRITSRLHCDQLTLI